MAAVAKVHILLPSFSLALTWFNFLVSIADTFSLFLITLVVVPHAHAHAHALRTMTLFSAKQVFPLDYQAHVSHRLIQASHSADLPLALHCISDPSVDVNFAAAVTLKTASADLLLLPESATQVRLHFQEFVSDVSPLFLAVHAANTDLVRKLLVYLYP